MEGGRENVPSGQASMRGHAACGNQMAAAAGCCSALGVQPLGGWAGQAIGHGAMYGRMQQACCLSTCPARRLVSWGLCWCNAGLGTGSAGHYSGLAWGWVPILPLLGFALLGVFPVLVCLPGVCALPPCHVYQRWQVASHVPPASLGSAYLVACVWRGRIRGRSALASDRASGPQCHCQGLGVFVRGRLSTAPAVGFPLVSGDTGCDWRIVATCAMTQVVAGGSGACAPAVTSSQKAGAGCVIRLLSVASPVVGASICSPARDLHGSRRVLDAGRLPASAGSRPAQGCRDVASCRSFQPRQHHLRSVSSAARHSDCGSHQTGASASLVLTAFCECTSCKPVLFCLVCESWALLGLPFCLFLPSRRARLVFVRGAAWCAATCLESSWTHGRLQQPPLPPGAVFPRPSALVA